LRRGREDVVSLGKDNLGRNNRKGGKRAVRLDEIGTQMEIRLMVKPSIIVIDAVLVKTTRVEVATQKASHAAGKVEKGGSRGTGAERSTEEGHFDREDEDSGGGHY